MDLAETTTPKDVPKKLGHKRTDTVGEHSHRQAIQDEFTAPPPPEGTGNHLLVTAIQSRETVEKLNLDLIESEVRYRTLFDLCPIAVYSCDATGVIQKFNQCAVDLWGRAPASGDTDERFCGSHKLFRMDGTFMSHDECPMAEVVSGKLPEVHDGEVFIEFPNGKRIAVVVNIRPLKNAQGVLTGAINCFYNVTDRKRAEDELREAGERFRFMAESMPQKIFTAQANGVADYFNQQWMEFTGLTLEQIRELGWKEFIHPDDLAGTIYAWRHSMESGEPFQYEHRFRGANGSYHSHLSRALPQRNAHGDVTMWIGSNTDIQAVRDQEERLRRSEKMAAAGQLAATMAHEINNPLSAVTSALYLLQTHDTKPDESVSTLIALASSELARVSRIVKQNLSYHREGIKPRDLDLGGIVNESLQIFSKQFEKAHIELKRKIQSTMLLGFPDELRQVIDNLLRNALEAMPNGGVLTVSARASSDWTGRHNRGKGVRLTIADSGCGVPKEYRARILEPFFTTKTEKGNGLGLWVSQGIIAKHDGVMSLRSSDAANKSGTIISIFLPFHSQASKNQARQRNQISQN
jgi:PAS domain S-box-containing protein